MRFFFLLFFTFLTQVVIAQFSVAKIFSSNMILQRDVDIPIWGWGKNGTKVSVKYQAQPFSTTIKEGKWEILLPKKSQGSDYQINISTPDTSIIFKNIALGDVWLCAGQSNMEWMVEKSINATKEIQNANYPNIRFFEVPHKIAHRPVKDIEEGTWLVCDTNAVRQFSGVGYFFGRKIHNETQTPIGLLSDNYGGTVVEAWMSPNAFEGMPNFQKQITKLATTDLDKIKKEGKTKFDKWVRLFETEDKGFDKWQNTTYTGWDEIELPSIWETNSQKQYAALDGVVWFQKEINLTQSEANEPALLSLGPIDDSDITWINGVKVGEMHNRYNKDRKYKIRKGVLKEGKNSIVIRVEDYIGGGGIYGSPSKLFLKMGTIKKSLVGTWNLKIGYAVDRAKPMPMGAKFGPNSFATLLYNGMIAPIQKFPIKGVIWYQGESNAYRAYEYKSLFLNWIRDWRRLWKNDKMPILWVQLANYQQPQTTPEEDQWAELREAQMEALSEPNTAMITAIDLGSAKTIHPLNKQDVGGRLAQAALKEVYGQPVSYKSPRYLSAKKKRNCIDITFTDVSDGLHPESKFGYVKGFRIAGKDKKFYWAKAKIIAPNKIRVFAPKGMHPISVRYAWEINPDPANIYNSEHLPLLPFRTDSWKLSTQGIIRE